MINRDEFEDGLQSLNLGRQALAVAAAEDEQGEVPEEGKPLMMAGVGRSALRAVFPKEARSLLSKSSADLVSARPEAARTTATSITDAEKSAVESQATKLVDSSNVTNVMESVQGQDDLTSLIEKAATFESQDSPRTFKDIAGDFESVQDVLDELEPVLKGQQSGLLTDRQLYGIRSLTASAAESAESLARQIASGNATPQTLLEFQNARATYRVLDGYAKGNAREVARALNQQKMVAKAVNTNSLQAMDDTIEKSSSGGGDIAIKRDAENLVSRIDRLGADKGMQNNFSMGDPFRIAVEYFKNNILSGWETHAVNISSVAVTNLWENTIIRPTAAGIGAARQKLGGEPNIDRVRSSEIVGSLMGSYVGIKGTLRIMSKTLITGESAFGAGKAEYGGAMHKFARDMESLTGSSAVGKAGNVAADINSLSFRFLRAEDDAMRGIAFTQQLYSLAARDAELQGLTGDAAFKHMNNLIDNPTAQMYDDAAEYAQKITFTNTDTKGLVGIMAQNVRALVGNVPALQFIVPFVNTPSNLLQYAIETSILAPVSSKLWKEVAAGGASKDMALAKMTTGVGLTAVLWSLYESGKITGSGPEDLKAKEMLKREGWQPNAYVFADGKVAGLERFDPFSMTPSIALAVDALDKAKYAATEEEAKKWFVKATLAMSENVMDSVWMKGIDDFYNAFDNESMLENYFSNLAANMVPYSGSLRSIKKMTDNKGRAVSKDKFVNDFGYQLQQRVMANLPIMSQYVRPKRYWDGKVIVPDNEGFAYAVSPVRPGDLAKGDKANRELFENGIFPGEPSSIITLGPVQFSLLEFDEDARIYDMYIQEVGKARRELVEAAMKNSLYQRQEAGPNGWKWTILEKAISASTKAGLANFIKKLEKEVAEDPELAATIQAKFSMNPLSFVRQLYDATKPNSPSSELKTKVKGQRTRKPLEIPRMNP